MIVERIQEALQSIGEVRLLEKSLTPTRHIRGPSFLRLAIIARPTRLFSSPFDFL
jgi:hypothetical protein